MSDEHREGNKARLDFTQDADEYKRVAQNQRAFCMELAARFESDQPLVLDPHERAWVAGALQFCAIAISGQPKGKRGPEPKFDAASEAVVYAIARAAGRRHGEVVDEISDRVAASRVAVEKGISKHRAAAFALIRKPDPGNNQ